MMFADWVGAFCYGSIGAAFAIIAVLWVLAGFLEDDGSE